MKSGNESRPRGKLVVVIIPVQLGKSVLVSVCSSLSQRVRSWDHSAPWVRLVLDDRSYHLLRYLSFSMNIYGGRDKLMAKPSHLDLLLRGINFEWWVHFGDWWLFLLLQLGSLRWLFGWNEISASTEVSHHSVDDARGAGKICAEWLVTSFSSS